MRKILWLVIACLPVSILSAQKVSESKAKRKKCYTAEYLQQLQKQNPNIESTGQFEQWMTTRIREKRATPGLNTIINYTPLPIVFHVIHTGQPEGTTYNISQNLIQAQLRQLNKDYANLSGSPYATASNTGIQFCLAAQTPGGTVLAQPGIDRINAAGKSYGAPPYTADNFDAKVKPATIWDPAKYINVWVTVFTDDEGILGYATFPGSSTLGGLDNSETNTLAGVAIDYTTVGSVGTPSAVCDPANIYNTGRTLTHELGHYFGLRHIWGDDECGNDYCDDTPQHTDANFGVPVHPKPNNCGTLDEMFENYMDYCDDKALNTFTLNQAERMQVVMLNSPRRMLLPTSTAGCGNINSASKIGFTPCEGTISISEKSNQANCPLYTDVKLYLNIEDRASGSATLNFSAAGNAIKGVDYEILAPSLNVAAGDSYKEVIIRIFDDAAKEADETIVISYTITGNGVVPNAQLPQSFTVTILDDDNLTISQNAKTIYAENFGTSGGSMPAGWSAIATLDYPTPKNRWVVSTNGGAGTTGQSLHISNNLATKPYGYTVGTASAHIARSPLISTAGVSTMNLSFTYKVAGEIDDDGSYDFGTVETSLQDDPYTFTQVPGSATMVGSFNSGTQTVSTVTTTMNAVLPTTLNGKQFYLNFYWENDDNTGTQPPLAIDDILITGNATKVESQLNNSRMINVSAADSNFIVSKNDNEILACISNSNASINCVNAVIQQAGTGQVDITTSTGIYKRSQKVVTLTQPSAGSTTYRLTLYFTADELAAWANINDLKVMKVQDGIALNTTLTPGNAILLTPDIKDLRATEGYASFSVTATGFSQFFLVAGNTTLPLQLISFNAVAVNNGAALTWRTGNEMKNKGFYVEKSSDGINFNSIGFVAGKNAAAVAGNYSYSYFDKDIRQGLTYYYRLQQVDIDGKTTWSGVHSVKLAAGATLVVYPNPAKNTTHVVSGRNMTASITLTAVDGKIVWNMPEQLISASGVDVPMQSLPAGVYLLSVQEQGNRRSTKIIKE